MSDTVATLSLRTTQMNSEGVDEGTFIDNGVLLRVVIVFDEGALSSGKGVCWGGGYFY